MTTKAYGNAQCIVCHRYFRTIEVDYYGRSYARLYNLRKHFRENLHSRLGGPKLKWMAKLCTCPPGKPLWPKIELQKGYIQGATKDSLRLGK